ncbi:phytoene desaturase family protein [Stetteria hydrogenophila]
MEFDVVVVGGGHNGVVAAIVLARHGFRVAVVERNPWLGGLAAGVPGGLPWSLYAYTVGLVPGELEEWLGLLPGMHRPDPSWVELDGDGSVVFRWWRGRGRLAAEAREAGVPGLVDLLDLAGRFWRCFKAAGLYYTPTPPSPEEAASLVDSCDAEAAVFLERSVEGILAEHLPREWWETIIYPSMLRSLGFALAYYLQNGGVWDQPVGGMASLSRRLEERARMEGVEVLAGAEARGLLVEGGRVAGVELRGGGVLRARRGVVYAAPIYTLPRLESAAGLLEEGSIRRLEEAGRLGSRVVRVDYLLRRRPEPPREEGWRGAPILVYWRRGRGGEYSYPTLYTNASPGRGLHLVQVSGCIEDPLDPLPPGVGEGDVVAWWVRGRESQAACCGNETGHPDHVPMVDPYLMDGRPLREWSSYATDAPGLYHASASSYPGGEVNGVAGVNAALRILLDSRVEPRIPLPWRVLERRG